MFYGMLLVFGLPATDKLVRDDVFLAFKNADVLLEWTFFDDVRTASFFFWSIYTAGYIDRKLNSKVANWMWMKLINTKRKR